MYLPAWSALGESFYSEFATMLRRHLEGIGRELPRLCRDLPQDLLSAALVSRAIGESRGLVTPESLDAPIEEYRKALVRARYIRNRFTVLDLSQDLGPA